MIDPLHMKLRIVENLIKLYGERRSEFKQKEQQIRTISNNHGFKFRDSQAKVGDDEDDEIDQSRVKVPFLNGKQCNSLLEEFSTKMDDLTEAEKLIWNLTYYIFSNWIDVWEPSTSFSSLEIALDNLASILMAQYPLGSFSFYLHIIIKHSISLLNKYHSLLPLSNQGAEAIHALAKDQFTQTNNDGGWENSESEAIDQVFDKNLRKFFIPGQNKDIKWMKDITSKSKIHSPKDFGLGKYLNTKLSVEEIAKLLYDPNMIEQSSIDYESEKDFD